MYLIRQLAAKYHLTRTALLHYDAIGLLSPSARTEAGYRLYSEQDEQRLQRILLFRSMGIPLSDIQRLLEKDNSKLGNALLRRLDDLNCEIGELKQQQKNVIALFKQVHAVEEFLSQAHYPSQNFPLLKGIKPLEWHTQFETMSPELHREFLTVLDAIPERTKEALRESLQALSPTEREKIERILGK